MARKPDAGFTLIELMLTVILVAILAAIAIPSYSAYVTRGQRAAAKVGLEQAAQYLERNYTANGCYNYQAQPDCTNQTGATQITAMPTALASAPTDGGPATYAITLAAVDAQSFTLNATPCASATCPAGSNTTFADSDCGVLSLKNTGEKGATGSLGISTCWQR